MIHIGLGLGLGVMVRLRNNQQAQALSIHVLIRLKPQVMTHRLTDPIWEAHDAPQTHNRLGRDTPPQTHSTRRLRRLDPRASGARVCPPYI